jgi:hypothetical protein
MSCIGGLDGGGAFDGGGGFDCVGEFEGVGAFDGVRECCTPVNPTRDLSTQVSWARLDSPEALEPDVSIQRVTASGTWNHRLGDDVSNLAVTAAVGQNNPSMGPTTRAALVESTAMFIETHTVFARAEALTKTGEELALPMEMADQKFGIGALSAGYIYDFQQFGSFVPGVGAVATVDVVGPTLGGIYDTRTPWGGMVFVRLRPPMMKMKMGGMQHSESRAATESG